LIEYSSRDESPYICEAPSSRPAVDAGGAAGVCPPLLLESI
jgi:hypothetical protein